MRLLKNIEHERTRTLISCEILNTNEHERASPRKYRTLRTWTNANTRVLSSLSPLLKYAVTHFQFRIESIISFSERVGYGRNESEKKMFINDSLAALNTRKNISIHRNALQVASWDFQRGGFEIFSQREKGGNDHIQQKISLWKIRLLERP